MLGWKASSKPKYTSFLHLKFTTLYRGRSLDDTIGDKDVERLLLKTSAEEFKAKTYDSLLLGREIGNMYCASLYGGLASLFAT